MILFDSLNLEKDSKRVDNLRGHSPSKDVVFGDSLTKEAPYFSLTLNGRGSKGWERCS